MSAPAAAVLAASDTGKGSPIGLLVILLLLVAVYLLYRSMTGHLRRLPEKFPGYAEATADEAATADGPARAGGAGEAARQVGGQSPAGADGSAAGGSTAGPDGERAGPPA